MYHRDFLIKLSARKKKLFPYLFRDVSYFTGTKLRRGNVSSSLFNIMDFQIWYIACGDNDAVIHGCKPLGQLIVKNFCRQKLFL